MPDSRRISFGLDIHDEAQLPDGVFMDLALERGLREFGAESWATAAPTLDGLEEPLFRYKTEHHESAVIERPGLLLQLTLGAAHLQITAAAERRASIEELLAELHDRFPAPDPTSRNEVPVTFWTYGAQGPQPAWRAIAVPDWEAISGNYGGATRAGLEALMRGFRPAHGGQLILWHGEAGTGKTFALRALAWEWRDWCQFHYIVDPDALFGAHADYLMSVLLQDSGTPFVSSLRFRGFSQVAFSRAIGEESEEEDEDAKPWRVLILEDTGELLSADARIAAGQGLSRFLNVVDGLIGQGLRVLVLVTTNEPIRRLHPAVARPGRSAANVEFFPLDQEAAADWRRRHGIDQAPAGSCTLASLYAQLEGRDPAELTLIGFGD
jgi:Domain of unknown function (DUF5925)/ATPase family associated with various cellular activities (AAA)